MKNEVVVGAYTFTFHHKEKSIKKTYVEILSEDGTFTMIIGGNTFAYGYLYAAMMQKREDQLHGFAVILNTTAMMLPQDEQFASDITKSIDGWIERVFKDAEKNVAETTESQLHSDEALMRDIAEETAMTKEERVVKSVKDRVAMRDVMSEMGESKESDNTKESGNG